MTPKAKPRPLLRPAVVVCVALLAFSGGRWWAAHNGPERLPEDFKIPGQDVAFAAMSGGVADPALKLTHTVEPLDAKASRPTVWSSDFFTGTAVVGPFRLVSRRADGTTARVVTASAPFPVRLMGLNSNGAFFERDVSPTWPGSTRITQGVSGASFRVSLPEGKPIVSRKKLPPAARFNRFEMWRMPGEGGPLTRLRGVLYTQAALVGRTLFWMAPGPDEVWSVSTTYRNWQIRGEPYSQNRTETRGHSALMATDVQSGKTRRIAGDMSMNTGLRAIGGYVYWEQAKAYGYQAPAPTTFRCAENAPRAERVTFLGGEGYQAQLNDLTAENGRLYWRERLSQKAAANVGIISSFDGRIVTMREDGADYRVLLTVPDDLPPQMNFIQEWRQGDTLYVLLSDWSDTAPDPVNPSPSRLTLCRMRSGSPRFRTLLRLPPGSNVSRIADGWCYYQVMENQERWWDWSPQGLAARSKIVRYRTRLRE